MKQLRVKLSQIFFVIVIIITVSVCKKDNSGPSVPASGDWSGTDISFYVNGNPLSVTQIIFSYSGYASGSYCSFSYESTTQITTNSEIANNAFTINSGKYHIEGKFKSDKTAEVTIEWSSYDSYCKANYGGTKTYQTSWGSSGKSITTDTIGKNSEILKIEDSHSKTYMIKRY